MTTIDHQQAAVEAMIEEAKNHRWLTIPDERQECDCGFVISAFPLECGKDAYKSHVAQAALTAATPHLRAAWEQPIRELCERAIRAKETSLSRTFNGRPFPATVYAREILALLEGEAE